MAQPIDPDTSDSNSASNLDRRPSRSVEQVYQQAVAAFRGQKYDQALGLFQRLEQLPPSSPYYIKALMGQVLVYQRRRQGERAARLCRLLLDSSSSQARQWAEQVLSQLAPEPQLESATGQNPESAAGVSAKADLSGFVPLEAPSPLPQKPTPLAPQSAGLPSVKLPAQQTSEVLTTSAKTAPGAHEAEALSLDAAPRSLFHFQQLNQGPGTEQAEQELPLPRPPSLSGQTSAANSQSAPRPAQGLKFQTQPQPQRPLGLWLGQGGTAIALLWVINWAFHAALQTLDSGLRWVRWPVQLSLPGANQAYTAWLVGAAVLLALAGPWMMDYVLAVWHRQQPLSLRQLQAKHPDVLRLLRQACRQRGYQLPELRLIPDPAPLCFSYGWLPGNTRIVVSQGLLDHCSDQGLTALYSYEVARLLNGSLPVLSAVGLPLLLLHNAYQWLAQVGDGLRQPLVRNFLGIVASLFYGLFWLLRQLVLWLSRLCSSWGDRRVVALTQHPDHLSEGLLELTAAIATHLQQRGTLHPLHSSLEVLMPVSSRQAITPGSLLGPALDLSAPKTSSLEISPSDSKAPEVMGVTKMLMTTEGLNPYRQWLRVNASHIPLGERLLWLNQQSLRLGQPGIILPNLLSAAPPHVSLPLLFRQKSPLGGLLLGVGLSMGLWFVGGIVNRLGWQRLSWLYQDPSILWGGLWLGLGLGLLLRINTLFPELQGQPQGGNTDNVATLLQTTSPLPVEGQPVVLCGALRGGPGLGNWGCQDLYLEDGSGLVRLTNPAPLGSLQGWLQNRSHPQGWIGRRVTVTGWGRHGGGMIWVDIHQIQLDQRHLFTTYGPIWATFISLGSCLMGIGIIFRGG